MGNENHRVIPHSHGTVENEGNGWDLLPKNVIVADRSLVLGGGDSECYNHQEKWCLVIAEEGFTVSIFMVVFGYRSP